MGQTERYRRQNSSKKASTNLLRMIDRDEFGAEILSFDMLLVRHILHNEYIGLKTKTLQHS